MSNDKTPAQAAAEEYPPMPFTNVPVHDLNGGKRAAFIRGAEWQASQAPSPSPKVDQIMEVLNVLRYENPDGVIPSEEIRSRLTALLDQTPSPR
mgnify:CR=1 FL=1